MARVGVSIQRQLTPVQITGSSTGLTIATGLTRAHHGATSHGTKIIVTLPRA
ncbi:MAG TPA: hypothetical protein VMV92_31020 [Streptosporangiaceae bacterium]|nr:hypothetical protein [Streptosporangiaceae bacterium]